MKRSMVVTDLDGTLLHRTYSFSDHDLVSLQMLGQKEVVRVIATGRSLYSALRVLTADIPIDYLVFSSGAGIVRWNSQRIVQKHVMTTREVEQAANLLLQMEMEFMIHDPIPDNHRFHYFGAGRENPDFIRRLDIYRDFATPADSSSFVYREACQLVAVEPRDGERSVYREISEKLHSLSVIRTTSPIDEASTWIEIFPPSVSKSQAAEWLRVKHAIPIERVLAVGNDFNDLDLLDWATHRYVVGNAPDELKSRFESVGASFENGFSEAVSRWLSQYNHR